MLFNAGDIAVQFPLCVSCAHAILIMIIFVIFTRMGPYDHVNLKNYFRLLQQGNFILLESSCLCLFASCLLLSLRDWSCVLLGLISSILQSTWYVDCVEHPDFITWLSWCNL